MRWISIWFSLLCSCFPTIKKSLLLLLFHSNNTSQPLEWMSWQSNEPILFRQVDEGSRTSAESDSNLEHWRQMMLLMKKKRNLGTHNQLPEDKHLKSLWCHEYVSIRERRREVSENKIDASCRFDEISQQFIRTECRTRSRHNKEARGGKSWEIEKSFQIHSRLRCQNVCVLLFRQASEETKGKCENGKVYSRRKTRREEKM